MDHELAKRVRRWAAARAVMTAKGSDGLVIHDEHEMAGSAPSALDSCFTNDGSGAIVVFAADGAEPVRLHGRPADLGVDPGESALEGGRCTGPGNKRAAAHVHGPAGLLTGLQLSSAAGRETRRALSAMGNAQGRVRPRSRGTAWARRAITLAVLAAGVWSVTASRADAGTGLIARTYMCPLPIIGTQPVTISFVRPALNTATVGVPTPPLPITATGTLAAAARLVVSALGAKWAEGTAVGTGEVDSPQGQATESVQFTVPRTDVATGSGPLPVSASGTLPSMTFSRPGGGEVLAAGLTFHISLLTSSGGQTWLSPFNVSCTMASGQSDVLASFRILPAVAPVRAQNATRGTATSPPPPRPVSPAPSPRPTPSLVTGSTAPPPILTPDPPPRPSSLAPCLLWTAGIVVAGVLGGTAWRLLRRWRAQRPAR
jgi:hypothetical protein